MKTLKTLLQEITAGIKAWANASFSSGTHVHGNIANNGKLATASKVVISDSNKNITTSNVSDTELGYLSGVTSAIQTQISSKAYDADVVHTTGNETIAGTKTFASEIDGTASKAVADEDGNNIKTTYGKLASANTWTDSNTFSSNTNFGSNVLITGDRLKLYDKNDQVNTTPSSSITKNIYFTDKNDTAIAYFSFQHRSNSSEPFRTCWRQQKFDGTNNYYSIDFNNLGEFYPETSNISLGASSYRWSAVYADSYYYGTTAWGLDKANVWTQSQTFKNSDVTIGTTTGSGYIGFNYTDSNSSWLAFQRVSKYSNGNTCFSWRVYNIDSNSQSIYSDLEYYITKAGIKYFTPVENGEINLGSSTTKWKTLNGVNPGALSLPDYATIVDISGSIVPPEGETSINLNGGDNYYVPTVNGWIGIRYDGATMIQVYRNAYNCPGVTATHPTGTKLVVTMPVLASITYTIKIEATIATGTARYQFYPCLGNV